MQVTRYAWTKIIAYSRAARGEVSGLARLNNEGVVDDAIIFEQKASYANVEVDAGAIAKFFNDNKNEDQRQWIVQWHSHGDMGAFFSDVDVDNILASKNTDKRISIVVNKRGEYALRLDFWHFGSHLISVNDKINVIDEEDEELIKACAAEVAAKVKGYAMGNFVPGQVVKLSSRMPHNKNMSLSYGNMWRSLDYVVDACDDELALIYPVGGDDVVAECVDAKFLISKQQYELL